jgi:hypothetical protein
MRNSIRWEDLDTNVIEGLHIEYDIMTEEEETELCEKIINEPIDPSKSILFSRVTLHYGYAFDPVTLKVNRDRTNVVEIPEYIQLLVNKFSTKYDQVTINIYNKKGCISGHVDTHSCFGGDIMVFSIGSNVTIQFISEAGRIYDVWVPRRSMLFMSGASRYSFKHKISGRSTDIDPEGNVIKRGRRISITYRTVNHPDNCICDCDYPAMCDSQNPESFLVPDRLQPDYVPPNYV